MKLLSKETEDQQLHILTGQSHGIIYDQIKTAFGVPSYTDIPDLDWQQLCNGTKDGWSRGGKGNAIGTTKSSRGLVTGTYGGFRGFLEKHF